MRQVHSGLLHVLVWSVLCGGLWGPQAHADDDDQSFRKYHAQGLAAVSEGKLDAARADFQIAYHRSQRLESLFGIAYCDWKTHHYARARLLLRRIRIEREQSHQRLGAEYVSAFGVAPEALERQLRSALAEVEVTIVSQEQLRSVRLAIDGHTLLRDRDHTTAEPLFIVDSPEDPSVALRDEPDGSVGRAGHAGRPASRTSSAGAAVHVRQSMNAWNQQFELQTLPSATLRVLLDPGVNHVFRVEEGRDFEPFINTYSFDDGGPRKQITLNRGDSQATLHLDLTFHERDGKKKPKDLDNVLTVQIHDSNHRLLVKTSKQKSIVLPPNRGTRNLYTVTAELAGFTFDPIVFSGLELAPGRHENKSAQWRERSVYRRPDFWIYLGVSFVSVAAFVAGGIVGYNRAHTPNGGSLGFVAKE